MKHTLITLIGIDNLDEFFYQLKNTGGVDTEYEYTMIGGNVSKEYTFVGAFHKVITNKRKTFYAIATNMERQCCEHYLGRDHYNYCRIMYRLNDTGIKFIQDYLFMKQLEKGGES